MKKDLSISLTPILMFFYALLAVDFFSPLNETLISIVLGLSIAFHIVILCMLIIATTIIGVSYKSILENPKSVTFSVNKKQNLIWTIFNLFEIIIIFYIFKNHPEYFSKIATLCKFIIINILLQISFKTAHSNLMRKLSK